MRKVLYQLWQPSAQGLRYSDLIHPGIYHGLANGFYDHGEVITQHTYALIETPDGTMIQVDPTRIKFTEPVVDSILMAKQCDDNILMVDGVKELIK